MIGIVRFPSDAEAFERTLERIRAALTSDAFAHAWSAGAALEVDEAVAWATRGRGERKRPATGWDSLTPVEREVVALVTDGLSNPEIANRLFVSTNTVKTHLSHVFSKLGITSRAELAAEVTRRQARKITRPGDVRPRVESQDGIH
jgi:DNA-binding NarL/FixJ family response regulator